MMAFIYELFQKPGIQLLFFILLTIVVVLVIKPENSDKAWSIAGYIYLSYMLINTILICTVPDHWNYFFYSLGFSVLYLLCISPLVPALIKILKIEGPEDNAMMFIYILYHPVLLLFALLLKWAYHMLSK